MDDQEKALTERVAELEGELVAMTAELVAIPTVNPYSGDSSAGSEAAGQDWIERKFGEMGASVRRVPVPADVYKRGGVIGPAGRCWDGRENVVAEWTLGDGSGPCVLLNDHMDTVGTEGMAFDPFTPVIRDGKMYGRGTSDTKGNLAMGLVAVAALQAKGEGLNGRIVFECVVDEECSGGGAGTLACCLAGVTGDFAICLDGASQGYDIGCAGIVTAGVRVKGRSGHAALGGAVNAIDKAIVAKEAIDAFSKAYRQDYPNCMTNVGVFRAGTHAAIVPDQAELQINMSYDISEAGQAEREGRGWNGSLFRARFEEAMARLAEQDPWFAEAPAEVTWIKDLYPFLCDVKDPCIRLVLNAASEIEGAPGEAGAMPAWFDAAHIARQLHVPVIGMGGGAPGAAHTAGEYVVIADLVRGARTLALVLQRYLGG